MIVPVRVCGATTVPMDVDVARHHRRFPPKGKIKRVMGRLGYIAMTVPVIVIGAMRVVMLDKARCVSTRLGATPNSD